MQNSGNDLKKFSGRLAGLIFGLFLYALGIAFTIEAHFGYAPWDVFHQGISNIAGISIGNASIFLGLVICAALYVLGESLGLGTLLNMVVIGVILDLILESKLIPGMDGPFSGTAMMVFGLFVISLATFFLHEVRFRIGSPRRTYGRFRKKIRALCGNLQSGHRITRSVAGVVDGWPRRVRYADRGLRYRPLYPDNLFTSEV